MNINYKNSITKRELIETLSSFLPDSLNQHCLWHNAITSSNFDELNAAEFVDEVQDEFKKVREMIEDQSEENGQRWSEYAKIFIRQSRLMNTALELCILHYPGVFGEDLDLEELIKTY